MTGSTTSNTPQCACGLPITWRIGSWVLQFIAAAILAQTLFFKFSGAEEPKFIFSTLGVEPWGRWAAGVSELIAVILLLTPRTVVLGAGLAIAVMIGAIGAHLGPLGISVKNDGGLLFGLAVAVLVSATGVLVIRREKVLKIIRNPLSVLSND
ncbi:MAG: DoxX family protein [Phycisphaerales bacterium]|nr:DoxX family protein [Phycisphaerales bacterium]